jgi:hypothetical protein
MRSFSIEDAVTKLVVSLEELPSFTTTNRFLASCYARRGGRGSPHGSVPHLAMPLPANEIHETIIVGPTFYSGPDFQKVVGNQAEVEHQLCECGDSHGYQNSGHGMLGPPGIIRPPAGRNSISSTPRMRKKARSAVRSRRRIFRRPQCQSAESNEGIRRAIRRPALPGVKCRQFCAR